MPGVPTVREYTVCEIHRDFFTAVDDADTNAQDAYSKILGRVYPSLLFEPRQRDLSFHKNANGHHMVEDPSTSESKVSWEVPQGGFLRNQVIAAKNMFSFAFGSVSSHETAMKTDWFQAMSWHKHKHWLALIAGPDQVMVHDFEDSESRDSAVLTSDSQRGVEALEWRPNGGSTLSVACRGGIAIWSASYPGNIAPVRSGIVSILGTPNRVTGARWALVDFLRSPSDVPVTALSWNPSGSLLASASREDSVFTIWDVAQGTVTPLRRGLGGNSFLRWSPTGDYFVSAKLNGTFHLWETSTWTSVPWSSAGGSIVSAMWNPDGQVLLAAFDRTTSLAALHFAGKPPSLDAHLLPLDLPDIQAITGGEGGLEKMAWDGSGERLAVTYGGALDPTYTGLVAIYDTRQTPIVSTSLIGFVRGPGVGAKPLALVFHDKVKSGALLAVMLLYWIDDTLEQALPPSSKSFHTVTRVE